jgi:hypothetical protein
VASRILPHREEPALTLGELVSCCEGPPDDVAFSGGDGSEDEGLNAPDKTPPIILPKGNELAATGVAAAGPEDSRAL